MATRNPTASTAPGFTSVLAVTDRSASRRTEGMTSIRAPAAASTIAHSPLARALLATLPPASHPVR